MPGPNKRKSRHSHGRSEIWSDAAFLAVWREKVDELAARLRQVRREAGLSQEEVAERAKLHPKSVQRLERGTARNPTIASLLAYVCACGSSLGDLFDGPNDGPAGGPDSGS